MTSKLLLLASCALLGACTMIPTYKRPAVPVQTSWPTGPAYGESGAHGAGVADDADWRSFYRDPVMQQAIGIALDNNRDLRIAQAQLEAAHDEFDVAHAQLFPTVNGVADADIGQENAKTIGIPDSSGPAYPRSYGLGLGVSEYEVDLWGRVRSLSRAAFERAMSSALNREAERLTVISAVATGILTYVADNEGVSVTNQVLDSWNHTYQLVAATNSVGTGTALDVAQAASALDEAKRQLQIYLRERAQALNALQLVLGAPIPAALQSELASKKRLSDLKDFPAVPAGLPSDLLEHRPDILSAEADLLSANANIGAARAAFFPKIQLTAQDGTASTHLEGLFSGGMAAWTFAPSITMPFFDAGRLEAELKEAGAEKREKIASYEKSVQTAFREVADALAGRGTYTQELDAQLALVQASQTQYDLSLARFQAGSSGYIDTLVAQRSLFSARLDLITTELARRSNDVSLYESLGGGWGQRVERPRTPIAQQIL